jgi:DNA processing protein
MARKWPTGSRASWLRAALTRLHSKALSPWKAGAIGVLGTGIDICYPKENKKLYEKVLQRGAILSEFPLGTHPAPENFPVRNRIVAGMPLGAIIVESAQYSGSLITARLAWNSAAQCSACPEM